MSRKKGTILLMGSGEFTATMVEVHKELLRSFGNSPVAVFIDTPAGFQLNADQISKRAEAYFKTHINHHLRIVSIKSKSGEAAFEMEKAYHLLRSADYMLVGPGSPTYAVRQWSGTSVPDIFKKRVETGACLAAASAAALTVGRYTLPVYEIYKVGQALHWEPGIDIFGYFGFNVAVIPHWNNAEGGTHDTRFCFMGESRFLTLQSFLPDDTIILGLDEHTACIIDFDREIISVRGIGRVTIRDGQGDLEIGSGTQISLDALKGQIRGGGAGKIQARQTDPSDVIDDEGSFWDTVHSLEEAFHEGLLRHHAEQSTNAILELDRVIWDAKNRLEDDELIAQAREVLRECMVLSGVELSGFSCRQTGNMRMLVEQMLELREFFRREKRWQDADAVRQALNRAGVDVNDTKNGFRWRVREKSE